MSGLVIGRSPFATAATTDHPTRPAWRQQKIAHREKKIARPIAAWDGGAMKKRTISDLRVKHLHADLGMAVGHASEILTGKKSPSLRLAVRLEDAYGIKPRAWLENLRERN
jgi:plasmid maintenance system antidote protein VapI